MSEFDADEFVKQSNAIEGYDGEHAEEGSFYFEDHKKAYKYCLKNIKRDDITSAIILETHKRLMAAFLPPHLTGIYRPIRVRVGSHICPEPVSVPIYMNEMIENANKAKTQDDCWNCHFEFESIHPFADGNGRAGRILLNAMLHRLDLDQVIIYAEKRQDYYGDIQAWARNNWEDKER